MIIFNFSVLALPGPELGARQPDPNGRALWHMFHADSRGAMSIVSDEPLNRPIFEEWLMRESYKAQTYEFLDTQDPVVKADKVQLMMTSYGRTGWYVDNDPRTIALTISKGIPSLLVGSPFTIRPEWETERKIKPWGELVEELDRQKLNKVRKTWAYLNEEEPES